MTVQDQSSGMQCFVVCNESVASIGWQIVDSSLFAGGR